MSVGEMSVMLFAVNEGYMKDVELNKVADFESALLSFMASEYKELMVNLDDTGEYSDDVLAIFKEALENSNQRKLGSMANTKEIRKQISSISNTQKITSAMEMVASSKMRKTQDRMEMADSMQIACSLLLVLG